MIPRDHGHFIYDRIFQRTEMGRVVEALAAASVERTKAGARHLLKVPAVRGLATDPRLVEIAPVRRADTSRIPGHIV